MKDRFGRPITYLRISVTGACNLRCRYCRPGRDEDAAPDVLSVTDILRVAEAAAAVGVTKVRLTGGEPLLRPDILDIVSGLAGIAGIGEVVMTTNGTFLAPLAGRLRTAGLSRVNVSLDSLKEDAFRRITGGELAPVLAGIRAAQDASLVPVRINTVLMAGVNDGEAGDFIALTRDDPVEVRFIELMPLVPGDAGLAGRMVGSDRVLAAHPELVPSGGEGPDAVARYWRVPGWKGRVGFVSPMTHRFCAGCDRLRLTADGKLRPCLGANGEIDILPALRLSGVPAGDDGGSCDTAVRALVERAIREKPECYRFGEGFSPSRTMNRIGG